MPDVKAIAFYLPQFHPIPENDLWWGKGFTEWTNVTRARPAFPGHHQPRLPADLGFYDLRLPEVRAEQAALARRYGIHGFCYYYYWFNGRRLLERPLTEVLRSGEPDLPFCICWANENWTRRWDGAEHEILVGQEHSPDSDRRFIQDVLPFLRDRRYIRVGGAPLLLVYRAPILPDPVGTTSLWRDAARRAGVGELHLAAVQSFGLGDPRPLGFDSGVEFPPHVELPAPYADRVRGLDPRFTGFVYDYREVRRLALSRRRADYPQFRAAMASWDNSPRRGLRAHIFHEADPREYERWLGALVEEARATRAPEERIVFINAWNEWAEGTHLEPDQRYGHAYLEATARALGHEFEPWTAPSLHWNLEDPPPPPQEPVVSVPFVPGMPEGLSLARAQRGGRMHLEVLDDAAVSGDAPVQRGALIELAGWAFAPDIEAARARTFLILRSLFLGRTFHCPVTHRIDRADVTAHFATVEPRFTARAGFEATVTLEGISPGTYRLGVVVVEGTRATVAWEGARLIVRG
jgi:hypothetical protein